ncbi:uncharacterized protein LOC128387433 [Panonychus citri]|uniref:uncharacterized protein LOC128387433 n=1 Tax=Panonychus citri TaxID=50023 RepID=UPI002307597E|nr:uncharacterized protein LOC128387433 [Panonychus citri]XP_053202606.1 uncharacterized protein LOC128387433 [Panonychus citri]XP_053202607.1 uncharacterized protein LOC128387433 [Panonychus citri]
MIQFVYAGRAYKRLIYFAFLWTCVCFLVYRLATNPVDKNYDYLGLNSASSLTNSGGQRGLLQNNPLDYSTGFISYHSSATTTKSSNGQLIDKFGSQSQSVSSSNPIGYPNQLLQAKVQVDNSPSLNEQEILLQLSNVSNLPLAYWNKIKKKGKNSKSGIIPEGETCRTEFPSLFELDYNNIYWQKVVTSNGSSFYLYGAYYDDRWRGGPLPSVRILAMIDRVKPPPTYCLLWFDNVSGPIISQATYTYGWYSKWGNYKDGLLQPYVINCKIPRIKGFPKKISYAPNSVSLVDSKCQKARNNLRVINNRPEVKQDFAVCVKGLDFLHEDLSVRLIEWIELLKILGTKKIFLYEMEIHPNISKVLNYYQEKGLVELTPITLPGDQPNLPGFRHLYLKNKLTAKRQNELIPYNDCLYRNLYSYSYLALLDIDEIIMPLQHDNWSDLMAVVERESLKEKNYSRASYNVRNAYFLDDLGVGEQQMKHTGHEPGIPTYLHMLQHVYRSRNYTKPGQYVKCFHNTERVVSLHNHFPLNCFGSCTTYSINTSLAHLQHYRKDCVGPLKNSCKTDFRIYTTRDTTIWKYKDQLIANSNAVLSHLGFFESPSPSSSSSLSSSSSSSFNEQQKSPSQSSASSSSLSSSLGSIWSSASLGS